MTSTTKAGGSGLKLATRRFVCLFIINGWNWTFFEEFIRLVMPFNFRLVPGAGWRSPTTPLRRTAWRGACLPPPPSPPPRSGTGPPAAITCSISASLSDLYLIINLMALETICIKKSIYVFQFKLSCIIQPVRKWCFLNGLNDHNQVWEEDRPWETVAVDIWRNTSQKLPCSPSTWPWQLL